MSNALIRYFNVIQKLSEEDKTFITERITIIELQPGQSWIAFSTGLGVGCVEKGLMKRINKKSKVTNRFLKEAECFPLMRPLFQWLYVAIEPTTIHYVAHEDMEQICKRHVRFHALPNGLMTKDKILRDVSVRIERQSDPLVRYRFFKEAYARHVRRIPQKEVAIFLDVSEKMLEAMSKNRGLKHI